MLKASEANQIKRSARCLETAKQFLDALPWSPDLRAQWHELQQKAVKIALEQEARTEKKYISEDDT